MRGLGGVFLVTQDAPGPRRRDPLDPARRELAALPQLDERFPDAAELLDQAASDLLAFTACPRGIWRQVVHNPVERLNREIRRRTDAVGIFPDRAPSPDLSTPPAEQNDERADAERRSTSLDVMTTTVTTSNPHPSTEAPTLLAA